MKFSRLPELKASYTEEDNDLPPDEADHYVPPDNY
jgi:hypothetical protein